MNDKMRDIRKLIRIELIVIPIFAFFKFIRPPVLKSSSPAFFKLVLLSLPNFFEAIIGMLTLTAIGLTVNDRLNERKQLRPKLIYGIAVILTGIYVVTQELKIHNLGGNNVYDQNDLIFSFIGLVFAYWIVVQIKPTIDNES